MAKGDRCCPRNTVRARHQPRAAQHCVWIHLYTPWVAWDMLRLRPAAVSFPLRRATRDTRCEVCADRDVYVLQFLTPNSLQFNLVVVCGQIFHMLTFHPASLDAVCGFSSSSSPSEKIKADSSNFRSQPNFRHLHYCEHTPPRLAFSRFSSSLPKHSDSSPLTHSLTHSPTGFILDPLHGSPDPSLLIRHQHLASYFTCPKHPQQWRQTVSSLTGMRRLLP